jgi:hypothetical protein
MILSAFSWTISIPGNFNDLSRRSTNGGSSSCNGGMEEESGSILKVMSNPILLEMTAGNLSEGGYDV